MALVMAVLDRFKNVNHVHGHTVCSYALSSARVVYVLGDWIAHFGGEVFAIVLPQPGVDGAAKIADRIRAERATMPIQTTACDLAVTVSLGVAALSSEPRSATAAMNALLAQADATLHQSKRDVPNRVTVAG